MISKYNAIKKIIEYNRKIFGIVINDRVEKATMSENDFLKLGYKNYVQSSEK